MKYITLLFVVVLLFVGCGESLPAPSDNPSPVSAPSFFYGRQSLSPSQQKGYDDLLRYLESNDLSQPFPISSLSINDWEQIFDQVQNDHPELYWVRIEEITDHQMIFSYLPGKDKETVQEEAQELERFLTAIQPQLQQKTDYDTALAIHDFLAGHMIYDYGFKIENSGNIYGGLMEGVGYCNGYARSFQYLASQQGLPVLYITGRDKKGTTHAWNGVQLGGDWFYVDVTWDRSSTPYSNAYHPFFAMTLEESLRERVWDETQYPSLPETSGSPRDFYTEKGYLIVLEDGESFPETLPSLAEMIYRQTALREEESKRSGEYQFSPIPTHVFVEWKVSGTPEEFAHWKNQFMKHQTELLQEVNQIAQEEGADFRLDLQVSTSTYFNDSLQTISFYPQAYYP